MAASLAQPTIRKLAGEEAQGKKEREKSKLLPGMGTQGTKGAVRILPLRARSVLCLVMVQCTVTTVMGT